VADLGSPALLLLLLLLISIPSLVAGRIFWEMFFWIPMEKGDSRRVRILIFPSFARVSFPGSSIVRMAVSIAGEVLDDAMDIKDDFGDMGVLMA
jgi:hypothetical protein